MKQIVCVGLMAVSAFAQERKKDLTNLNLEELMNIEVTSVSKKEEKLFQTAAAVFVITQDDIRHSGATSMPELLRIVPGLEVARIDASHWAVSSRGFNGQFANKMLVLIDGRVVYTTLFSGVFWDAQDLMLEDIDRIEVIRGPGATVWGANAVNGVINIITRRAEETQGGLIVAGAGTEERGFASLRYGGKLGQKAHYRVYAKYFDRSDTLDSSSRPAADGWDALRGGFRLDWAAGEKDSLTFQGDIYDNDENRRQKIVLLGPPFLMAPPTGVQSRGGNALARWNHSFSARSRISLQTYYDRASRMDVLSRETRDTVDIDLQHHIIAGRHDLVWGAGYRRSISDLFGASGAFFDPRRRSDDLLSAFIQDEITLVKDRFRLTLGSKFEENDYTGFEIQPSLRLLWTPTARHTLWGAVSRAVRTPSRAESESNTRFSSFPGEGGLTNVVIVRGNPDFKSEEMIAYEVGYRVQPGRRLFFDVAAFYNSYDHLRSVEPEPPLLRLDPPRIEIPLRLDNKLRGEAHGVEMAANLRATKFWQLSAAYTWFGLNLRADATSRDQLARDQERSDPRHQFHLMSNFNLPHGIEIDAMIYRVGKLASQSVPAYTRFDARFSWQATENLTFTFAGQDLLDNRHQEFGDTQILVSGRIKRSAYGKISWRF
ncbi:MAG: TonB-dependent receptor [Acidobacteriota bacterium]